ncbi:hypothetical protein JVV93_19915, partial [Vibrio cholerae O1]|nr:hypothetical protein [Vibrio cholerae O1]
LAPILKGIVKNPLIIAILAALPFGLLGIELPQLVITTGNYFANMTLPLAPLFVLMYLLYVRRELKQTDSHDAELPSPLKLD